MKTRSRTSTHSEQLKWSTESALRISATFNSLTKLVFSNHFVNSFPRSADELQHQDKGTREDVAGIFYDHCYSPTTIRSKSPSQSAGRTLDDIIFHEGNYDRTSHIAWITGGVGMGKSSGICNWLRKNHDKIIESKRLFVRIDIDKKLPQADMPTIEQLPTINEFIRHLLGSIKEAIKGHFGREGGYSEFNSQFNRIDMNDADAVKDVCNLIRKIYDHSVTIILDNLDYLVYTHDRYLFCEDYKAGEMAAFEGRVKDYLDCFADRRMVLVSGFSLVVVSRDTSQAWLRRCDVKDRVITATLNEFAIDQVKPFDVVVAHYKLMSLVAKNIKDKRVKELADEAAVRFDSMLKSEKTYSEDLQTALLLAGNGLRGIVELANFLLIPLGGEVLRGYHRDFVTINRILDHEYLMPRSVMLNFHVRYSQRFCDFPNLFLINSKRRPRDEQRIGEHKVTYWLKVFLLLYIGEWDKRRDVNIGKDGDRGDFYCDIGKIEQTFCKGAKAYSAKLVRVAIGSMFSTAGSGLITTDMSVNRANEEEVRELPLRLTNRGEVLLECLGEWRATDGPGTRRAYDFRYIELIVEDHELPIPTRIYEEFRYMDVDYSYLCRYEDVKSDVAKMCLWKNRLVAVMYAMLHAALKEEYKLYEDVVRRLIDSKVIRGDGECFAVAYKQALGRQFISKLPPELDQLIQDEVSRIYKAEKFEIVANMPDGRIPS